MIENTDEWIIREAFIRDSKGNKIIDFKDNNLHVVNYSNPIKANLNYYELEQNSYSCRLKRCYSI